MNQATLFQPAAGDFAPGFVPLEELTKPGTPAGIARMAALAEEIDFRNEVEYRDIACRSLISAVRSERVPFEHAINPYRGCEFGCTYCYARYTHEYMELENWVDFERKIFVKRAAREALLNDLRRLDLRDKSIAIGSATDPYQPAERRYRLTRSLLEVFAGRRGLRLSITTKSDLVVRDLDLLTRIREHNHLHVNVTITTPHYALSRITEPRAPRPDKRLAAVRALTGAGVNAGVFIMPVLPRINDAAEDLDLLMRLASEAGARYLASNVLFLRKSSRKRFFPFIEEHFPQLVGQYRRMYARNHTPELTEYSRRMRELIESLKRKHGLARGREPEAPAPDDQLTLL